MLKKMPPITARMKAIVVVMITAALLLPPGFAFSQTPETQAGQGGTGRYVTIDFNNVDINVFIKW